MVAAAGGGAFSPGLAQKEGPTTGLAKEGLQPPPPLPVPPGTSKAAPHRSIHIPLFVAVVISVVITFF